MIAEGLPEDQAEEPPAGRGIPQTPAEAFRVAARVPATPREAFIGSSSSLSWPSTGSSSSSSWQAPPAPVARAQAARRVLLPSNKPLAKAKAAPERDRDQLHFYLALRIGAPTRNFSGLPLGIYHASWASLSAYLPNQRLVGSGCEIRRFESIDAAYAGWIERFPEPHNAPCVLTVRRL